MDLEKKAIRILLVDANKADREAFRQTLIKAHPLHEITGCDCIASARTWLEKEPTLFDVVLVDALIEGHSGLRFCQDLLSREICIPVVLITEPGGETSAMEALKGGVDDCIVKGLERRYTNLLPFRLEGIIKKVRESRLRIAAEAALQKAQDTLGTRQAFCPSAQWQYDIQSNETTWSDPVYDLFLLTPGSLPPSLEALLSYVHPNDLQRVKRANREACTENKSYDMIFRIIRKDGVERIVRAKARLAMSEAVPLGRLEGTLEDITEMKRVEDRLAIAEKVIETTIEGVMITDQNGVISNVNPAFIDITGYRFEELIGRKPNILKSFLHDQEFYRKMWHSLIGSGRWQGEIWNRRKSGGIYPARLTITAIGDSKRKDRQYVSVYYDITNIKESEKEIKYKAYHDALTGLPNRLLFYDRLNHTINRAKRNKNIFALLFIDLDDFKNINNRLGHPVGDLLLKEVAERLKACARRGDTVSRLGGDEFAIILDRIEQAPEAAAFSSRVVEALSQPFSYQDDAVYSSVSLGISLYPENGETGECLLKNADTAMYHAKDMGKNNYHFFTESLNERLRNRLDLENALRKAILGTEMLAYYQPIYSLQSSNVVGMEALVRWCQAGNKIVLPADFIPLAEEKGFIVDIDMLMIQKACAFIKKIQTTPYTGMPQPHNISVNLSAVDFGSINLYKHLTETVETFGLQPDNIGVEITESVLIKDIDSAIVNLKKLRDKGFSVSIDDFGMGYSSLSYLAKLPINILKIDRSFITDLPSDKSNNAIAKAIVFMAHEMNIKVIAEGVETEAQLDFLASIGCDQIQGFIYSLPLPEAQIEELLINSKVMNPMHSLKTKP